MYKKLQKTLTAVMLFSLPFMGFGQLQPPPPDLGDAAGFVLFTSVGAFINNDNSVVTGDVGTNMGAFSGFPPGTVIGATHVEDGASALAEPDVDAAYMYLDGILGGMTIGVGLGTGQTLTPDVYILGSAATLDGVLNLDAEGDPDAIFIFQIDGAFSTTSGSSVVLMGGASLCNVYWQINGAVDLGDGSVFRGTILAAGAITLLESADLFGQALTTAGQIELHNNIVTIGSGPTASIITASGPTSLCEGESVTLSGNVGGVWSTGEVTPSIVVTTSGDYFVTNTDACGSVTSNHIQVTVAQAVGCGDFPWEGN